MKRLPVLIPCVGTAGVGRPSSLSQRYTQLVIDEFKHDKDVQIYRSFVKYFRTASSKIRGYVDSQGAIAGPDEMIPPRSPSHNGRLMHQNEQPLFYIAQIPTSELLILKHSSNISYTFNAITKVPLTIVSCPKTCTGDEKH